MIDVENLTKRYGSITAISGISFTVARGEVVGFLGPNGAGKSTTMRILTGFFPASSGTARIDGHEVHQHPIEVKRRVGYMPERVPLYDEMTVLGFLRFVAQVKGVGGGGRKEAIERAMEHCGLTDMRRRQIGNLSKGYRQRVGLAQALLGAPPVLILDEPTAGLDPKQIVEIRELISALRGEHTVLISTHILPEVAMVCDRAIIIHQGKVVAEDRIDRLTGGGGAESLEKVFIEVIARGTETPV
ncbi:MAG: ATP-binding cassette domain-containing protein [Candidatus Hydrogenedens sp.]|nr:ATP-binding cassette domain-containing protein [Candidatus Hydrogenedens sp.]